MSQPTLAMPLNTSALQGPAPTRSRSIFKRVASKLTPAKPPPAVPPSSTKEAREDALRARGLLPPKDLSSQEAERDALLATPVMQAPDSAAHTTEQGEVTTAAQKILEEWRQRAAASKAAADGADASPNRPSPPTANTISEEGDEEDANDQALRPDASTSDEVTPSSHADPEAPIPAQSTISPPAPAVPAVLSATDVSPQSSPQTDDTAAPRMSDATSASSVAPPTPTPHAQQPSLPRKTSPPPPILVSSTPTTNNSASLAPPLPSPRLVPLPPSPILSPLSSPRLQVPAPPALRIRSDTVGTSGSEIPSLTSADGASETDNYNSPLTPRSADYSPPLRSVPEDAPVDEAKEDADALPPVNSPRTRTMSTPQRKPSLFNSLKRQLTTSRPRRRASPSPSRAAGRSTSNPPAAVAASADCLSPPTSPTMATNSPAGKKRSSTLDSVAEKPRVAVQPQMYSMGAISHQAGAIEDEESRRLSEMAFLDW